MSWDESLVSFETPPDGRILSAIGGASGNMRLENGAKITLPWRSQQEIAGTTPAYVQAVEVEGGGVHRQDFYFGGPSLLAGTTGPYLRLSMHYTDDSIPSQRTVLLTANGTDGIALNDQSGARTVIYGDASMAGDFFLTGTLDLDTGGGVVATTAGYIDVVGDGGHRTFLGSGSGQNLTIQGGSTSDVLVNATGAGGDLTLSSTNGAVTLSSGTSLSISAGTTLTLTGTTSVTVAGVNLTTAFGSWTSYTPTIGGTGSANGNGTLTGYYMQLGKLLIVRVRWTLGTTSTVGTTLSFALPSGMTAVTETDQFQMNVGMLRDTGTTEYLGTFRVTSGATAITAYALGAGGTYTSVNAVSSTVPHTWANTDVVSFVGLFQIA